MVYQPTFYMIFTRECNIKPCLQDPWYLGHNTSMPLWQFTIGAVIAILLVHVLAMGPIVVHIKVYIPCISLLQYT